MLTSTDAIKRKGALALYRALRVQITRFEEAFVQLHGRRPKGAIEKAPLASTYAQYREWKRFIRADAARRIQALFRGARTRRLLQRNTPQVPNLVEAKATKRSSSSMIKGSDHCNLIISKTSALDEIRFPAEIFSNDNNRCQENAFSNHERDDPSTDSTQDTEEEEYHPFAPLTEDCPIPNLPLLSLPDLQARKRELKHRLKEFDMKFMVENGRMPNKSEKEPIRFMYDRYNALKDLISRKTFVVPDN